VDFLTQASKLQGVKFFFINHLKHKSNLRVTETHFLLFDFFFKQYNDKMVGVETAFAPISSRTLIFQDTILAFDHEVNMKNLNSETKHSSIELEI